jgi:PilZ domain-containing protein
MVEVRDRHGDDVFRGWSDVSALARPREEADPATNLAWNGTCDGEPGMSGSESRRTKRVRCCMPARWMRLSGDIHAVVIDINAHGLFLRTDASIDTNMLMRMEIKLPDGPVTVIGVARFVGQNAQGRGIGVAIFAMDEEQKRRWLAHYRSLAGVRSSAAPLRAVTANVLQAKGPIAVQ